MLWNKEGNNLVVYEVSFNDNYFKILKGILNELPKEREEFKVVNPYFQRPTVSMLGGKMLKDGYDKHSDYYFITNEKVKTLEKKEALKYVLWSYDKALVPDYFWEIWNLQNNNYTCLEKTLTDFELHDLVKRGLNFQKKATFAYQDIKKVFELLKEENSLKDEIKHFYEIDLTPYLERQKQKRKDK